MPALLVAATAPAGVLAWRHSGEERRLRQARMDAWRHADYHLGLAVGLEPAREVRLFGMGDWLVDARRPGGPTPWPCCSPTCPTSCVASSSPSPAPSPSAPFR